MFSQKDPKLRLRDIGDAPILLEEAPAPPARSRVLPWVIATALAAVAIIAMLLVWRARRPVSQPLIRLSTDLADLTIAPPIFNPGPAVVLSPDGTRIVYTARGPDGHRPHHGWYRH